MSTYDETPPVPGPAGEPPRASSSWADLRAYSSAPDARPGPGSLESATRAFPAAPPTSAFASPAANPETVPPVVVPAGASGQQARRYPATTVPQVPAGYSFERAAPAPTTSLGGYEAPDVVPTGPGAPTGHAAPTGQRRGPGWGALVGATLATALIASGGTATATHFLSAPKAQTADVEASAVQTGSTETVANTTQSPDWQAVSQAVSATVVSIAVALNDGTSQGSGVIYDSSGHIITNNHVVEGATKIQVTLADGRIFKGELTGTDPATDLAVIQIVNPPQDLVVAGVGDSGTLSIGQGVMAIGNPLGLSSTVTTGIISALNRPVVTTHEEDAPKEEGQDPDSLPGLLGSLLQGGDKATSQVFTNAIQVDAAINPGNSGGPLFDEHGLVIGINSSIATASSSSNGSIGIGFAIPSQLAKKVADQIIATGKATHAYLGVTLGDGAASAEGVTRAGAEVGTVEAGSPAEQAGLQGGDVITAIDGKPTSQAAALTGFVRQYSSGDEVTLTIIRGDKQQEVKATLAERADA